MTDLSEFKQYNKLADWLIDDASKDQLAECARLLALNLARHHGEYGEMPLDETLLILTQPNPTKKKRHCSETAWKYLLGCWGLA